MESKTMLRVTVAVGMALLAMGCAYFRPSPEEVARTGQQRFSQRWAGLPEDDVSLQYGKPDDVMQLSNGNHVNGYHREVAVSGSQSRANQYVASSSSESTTIYCDRRFEIDKDTHTVTRAIITGSGCDYSK